MHVLGPEVGEYEDTAYQVLRGDLPLAKAIRPIPAVPGLDLLPVNISLSAAEAEFLTAVGRERLLADVLDEVKGYDYVFIDSRPLLDS
jgi:cellulose biosynthesis protein BcsQ